MSSSVFRAPFTKYFSLFLVLKYLIPFLLAYTGAGVDHIITVPGYMPFIGIKFHIPGTIPSKQALYIFFGDWHSSMFVTVLRSLMKIIIMTGANTDPYGTPRVYLIIALLVLSYRKPFIH